MMLDTNITKKTVMTGEFEDVVEIANHFFLVSKKNRVAVVPYTIDSKGLLDKIGVVKDYNYLTEEYNFTIINDYVTTDDGTNLVAANRILHNVTHLDMPNADKWMYLGELFNTLTSDSALEVYCVDLTNKNLKETEKSEAMEFEFLDSFTVITSDDTLLLSSYFRLFNYFYTNALREHTA
jgi:hypothetical protein